MNVRCSLAVLAGGALLLGCGPRYVKLETKKVRDLTVTLVEGRDTVCPNAWSWPEVVAIIRYDDGKRLETRTPRHKSGQVRSSDLQWTAEVGTIDEQGVWRLPDDLLSWYDRTFTVRAAIPTRPDLASELRVTPRFDCGGGAAWSGFDGEVGSYHGGEGSSGGPGPRLEVALAYVDTTLNGRLILVRTIDRDRGRQSYHLVDPRAATRFVVAANGGDGGDGAAGSDGMDGTDGTKGWDGSFGGQCEDGTDGSDGTDGTDGGDGDTGGSGGDGGNGGVVLVTFPTAFPELTSAIAISVEGGSAGRGGAGGQGGEGGDGGDGGQGGTAGSTIGAEPTCFTSSGHDGRDGSDGRDGNDGSSGPDGESGSRGRITAQGQSIEELFASEIARGWRIVVEPPDVAATP